MFQKWNQCGHGWASTAVLQVEAYMVFEYTLPLYAQLNRSFKLQLTINFPFLSQKQDLKKALEFSDFD